MDVTDRNILDLLIEADHAPDSAQATFLMRKALVFSVLSLRNAINETHTDMTLILMELRRT